MTTLNDIEKLVERNQELCDTGRPATDELIKKAEAFLGLQFPDDYRAFLKRWGTLSVGSVEFYGICDGDFVSSSVPDAIWYTQRKRDQLGLPNELVVLCDNNGDEFYCLDTCRTENSCIVVWDANQKTVRSVKAGSLFEFISNEIADVV